MATEHHTIEVSDILVGVVRKPIKNLRIAVYPPEAQVRVAVPRHANDEAERLAVIAKLDGSRDSRPGSSTRHGSLNHRW